MKLAGLENLKKIKFGIVQGRLSQSPKGAIQYFPKKWEDEFQIASTLGLDNIELIADREHNIVNPIWSKEGIEKLRCLDAGSKSKLLKSMANAFCRYPKRFK